MLHYPKKRRLKVYWLLPRKELADGLRIVSSDVGTLVMASVVHKMKNFVLYLDHDDIICGLD